MITKGPWKCEHSPAGNADYTVSDVSEVTILGDIAYVHEQADALAIAAVPEMIEALEMILNTAMDCDEVPGSERLIAMIKVEAALKKAGQL